MQEAVARAFCKPSTGNREVVPQLPYTAIRRRLSSRRHDGARQRKNPRRRILFPCEPMSMAGQRTSKTWSPRRHKVPLMTWFWPALVIFPKKQRSQPCGEGPGRHFLSKSKRMTCACTAGQANFVAMCILRTCERASRFKELRCQREGGIVTR